jgi:hypothetical protein
VLSVAACLALAAADAPVAPAHQVAVSPGHASWIVELYAPSLLESMGVVPARVAVEPLADRSATGLTAAREAIGRAQEPAARQVAAAGAAVV